MGLFVRIVGTALALAWAFAALDVAAAVKLEARSIESDSAEYRINASYPHTGIKAIDADIVAWVNAEIANLKANGPPDPEWASGAYTLDIEYDVVRNDDTALAVLLTEMIYTGGAHPNHSVQTFNYRMPAAQRIALDQVIDGDRGLQRLSTLAIADLLPRLTAPEMGADPDGIRNGAGPDWKNFEHFLLYPETILFIFPPYQVAAYVFGAQEVTLPLSSLSDVLLDASGQSASAANGDHPGLDHSQVLASFDCRKAGTPTERTICSDMALAQLDYELAETYSARLAAATDSGKQALKTRQRAWLKIRDQACHDQAAAAAVSCLTGVYRARLSELSASR